MFQRIKAYVNDKLILFRNKLSAKFPYFVYIDIKENEELLTQIRHDTNSYSFLMTKDGKNKVIRTGRYNFSEIYNILFDNKGKRYCTVFVSDNEIIINHNHSEIIVKINKENVGINIFQKEL